MRFEDAERRLATLAGPFPPPDPTLIPTIVAGPSGQRWPARPDPRTVRLAAVLVLIMPGDAGDARTVLIERTSGGGHHSGEVSFPGGKTELHDVDATATALREACEEIGLEPAAGGLRVVGTLEPFWIPVSDFQVTPVVAIAAWRPELIGAPREVARIVNAPIAAFLPGAEIGLVERRIGAATLRYGAFAIDGLSIWGATARILSQLGIILARDIVAT